jgi:hypothetical protein
MRRMNVDRPHVTFECALCYEKVVEGRPGADARRAQPRATERYCRICANLFQAHVLATRALDRISRA